MVYLATDLDREGEAIAWHVAEAAHVPSGQDPAGDVQRDHRAGDPRGVRPPARHRHEPRRRAADAADRRPAGRLHAQPAALAQGPRRPVGRARPVGRGPPRRRARARDRRASRRASTGRSRRSSRPRPASVRRRARPHRRRGPRHRRRGDGRRATSPPCAMPTRSSARSGSRTQKRSPAPPFTTSTLQQEASRKLAFSPKRTMSVAQRLYEGVDTADGHVGLITYMRTDSTAMAGVAMGEAREVIGERYGQPYTMPKGRVYKTKSKGAQEAHESIRPTCFRRDPDSLAGTLKPEELRLYRLIWQRALASQMARQGARDDHGRARRRPVRAAGDARPRSCSTASPASTPRAATTTPPTTRTRAVGCRPSPRATGRASATSPRPSTSPSRRRASPRRRSSRRSRSTASAGRRRTRRRSRRSSTAATSASRSGGSTRSRSP